MPVAQPSYTALKDLDDDNQDLTIVSDGSRTATLRSKWRSFPVVLTVINTLLFIASLSYNLRPFRSSIQGSQDRSRFDNQRNAALKETSYYCKLPLCMR